MGGRSPGSARHARRPRRRRDRSSSAQPRQSRRPAVVARPGETTALQSAHAADLASHGYVVVGMDHPGDTQILDLGDGQLVPPVIEQASEETIAIR